MTKQNRLPVALLSWLKIYLPVILLVLAFALFVSKSLYNYPVGLMALLGLYRLLRSPKQVCQHPLVRIYACLFFCLWVPMLIALADAASIGHSMRTVFPYVRFLFLGIYLIYELNRPATLQSLLLALFCLLALWCIDAIAQALFLIDFFGYPYEERHITGMFYPKNTIAHICAGMSPLFFELIRQKYTHNKSALLLTLPLFAVIILSGRRAAWIMLALSLSGFLYYFFIARRVHFFSLKQLLLLILVFTLALGSVISLHEPTRRRVEVTLGLFSGDYETINLATARRLPLWHTSLRIAREHWINGVGPRGYRHVYSAYADEKDIYKKSGQTHPHQLLLEVVTETGVLGLLGLFLFLFIYSRFVLKTTTDPPLFPWALAVFIVIFPINTHMAFYGSYWSSFFWLLVALSFVVVNCYTRPLE